MRDIDDVLDQLPAVSDSKPLEEWTEAELLRDNVRLGLLQGRKILSQPLRVKQSEDDELPASEIRVQRVVSDVATGYARLLAHIQETALRQRSGDKSMDELLADIAAERAKREARANGG